MASEMSEEANIRRFHKKVLINEETGCWEWQGQLWSNNYGKYRGQRAHRWSYEHFIGPIPAGMLVCHRCDNRKCVNPEHLWLGTYLDNNWDSINKGRHMVGDNHPARLHPEKMARGDGHGSRLHPERRATGDRSGMRLHPETHRGEKSGVAKLNEAAVIEIFRMRRKGLSEKNIAENFNVSRSAISAVLTRRHWGYVSIEGSQ
jgi:hypothetical protein